MGRQLMRFANSSLQFTVRDVFMAQPCTQLTARAGAQEVPSCSSQQHVSTPLATLNIEHDCP